MQKRSESRLLKRFPLPGNVASRTGSDASSLFLPLPSSLSDQRDLTSRAGIWGLGRVGRKCPLSESDFPFLNESFDEDAAMFGLTVELLNTGAEICLSQFKEEACEVPPAEVDGL